MRKQKAVKLFVARGVASFYTPHILYKRNSLVIRYVRVVGGSIWRLGTLLLSFLSESLAVFKWEFCFRTVENPRIEQPSTKA